MTITKLTASMLFPWILSALRPRRVCCGELADQVGPATKGCWPLEWIKVIFEEGDDDRDLFSALVMRELGDRPVFRPKAEFPSAFVAGDILAWRHARLLRRRGLVEKGHACFAGLFKQLPHDSCQCLGTKETFELAQRFGKSRG
jgi:hypothetical protein